MDWKSRKVLVTGATGFLGSHLTRRLIGLGAHVDAWASSRTRFSRLADVEGQFRFSLVDIRDFGLVQKSIEQIQPDVIYHCAAYGVNYDEQEILSAVDVNVRGTAHL